MGWNEDRTMYVIDDTTTIPDMNKIMKLVEKLEQEEEERKKFQAPKEEQGN